MKIVTSFALFLVSEWIWGATLARAQIFLSMPLLLLMLFIIARARPVPALLIAFFAPLFSLTVFTLLVHIVIDRLFGITFPAVDQANTVSPFYACFLLALIHLFFQWLFFLLIDRIWSIPVKRYTLAALAANCLAMLPVYKFLPPL
jgi:hypothetical protein